MSDVNATIQTVDNAMDIMDAFSREVHDLRAHVNFEIDEVVAAVEREKWSVEECACEYEYNFSDAVDSEQCSECNEYSIRVERLRDLSYFSSTRGDELKSEWTGLCMDVVGLADDAKRVMGEYIRKLNKIGGTSFMLCKNTVGNDPEYYVVIIDSKKYPQTAEHIKMAQNMGLPEFVTLGRSDAANRRKASLANVRASNIYDRDEWPMAVFREGGTGANVVYVDGSDNRGAGSSISWQMRNFPDGSRVRVRVI